MKLVPHPFFFLFFHKSITAVFKKKKLSLMSLWGSTRGTEVRVYSAEDPGLSFKGPLFYARSTYNYSTNDNGITQSDAKLLHLGWISVCVGGRVGGWRRTWGVGGAWIYVHMHYSMYHMNLNSLCYVTVSGNREGLRQMLFQATILVSDVKASYQTIKTNTYVQIYIYCSYNFIDSID